MTATKRQWLYLFITLVILLPLVLAFAFSDQIYGAYLREFVAPQLERDFGFKGGMTRVVIADDSKDVFTVVTVTPGGMLQKAGVEPGDIPVGYQHGFETGFLQDLLWAKEGQVVEIEFARPPDFSNRKRVQLPL